MYLVAMIKVNYVGSQFSGVSELRCDDPSLSCRSRSQTYSSAHVGAAAGRIVGNFHHIIRTLYKENNNVTIVQLQQKTLNLMIIIIHHGLILVSLLGSQDNLSFYNQEGW